MSVGWSGDAEVFAASRWSELAAADPEATLFHSPRYLKLYWEELAPPLQVATVQAAGEPIAVAPFEIDGGRASFLGGFDVTDYMGPVGPLEARERAAKEIVAALAARSDWREADLRGLPEDGTWLPVLEAAALEAGLKLERSLDGAAPVIELPSSFDEYVASIPAKHRHELRRKLRRMREAHPDVRLVDATAQTVGHDLARFASWHRASPGPKGGFMGPAMELFFRRLADELLPDGTMRLSFLEASGRRLAGAIGFRDRDAFRLYNSAYEQEHGRLSPGIVLVAELIRSAISEGRRTFDLLKDAVPYKYRLGARHRGVARLLLSRGTRPGP